jgi:hypothetical protein
MIRNFAHPDRSSIIKLLHRHGDAIGGCIVGFWHFRDIARSQIDFRFRWKNGHAADIAP